MRYDIVIQNGRVIDPARGINEVGDIGVRGDRMESFPGAETTTAEQIIDATDCLVVPGLIDFHTHLFFGGSDFGISPDLALLPNGVTTAVDSGSTGYPNYEAFHRGVVAGSQVRIKSFLNVSPMGQPGPGVNEDVDPKYYHREKMAALFRKYPGEIIGLKLRLSQEVVGALGSEPLYATLRAAEELGCPMAVHVTNPPLETAQLVEVFRKGDIFTHVFHGKGSTIIDPSGKVLENVKAARERGVVFDAANGRSNFSFETAQAALEDAFPPDIISSDITAGALYHPQVFSLPHILSKYYNLGLDLEEIITACTATPAYLLGMAGKIGTLAPGAWADIAIFKLIKHPVEFKDSHDQSFRGEWLLKPELTIRAGKVVYRQLDF